MSADNGIYILKTKDNQYRVIHAQAIENLYFSFLDSENKALVPTRIVEYFGDCKFTWKFEIASKVAFSMEQSTPICEYGIKTIHVDKTWKEIIKEAKELAVLEMEEVMKRNDNGYDMKHLQKIIKM
jgi:hypothetical protein